MQRKVCVVVTARPSYSRIKTALTAIQAHPDLELQLVVAASALLDRSPTTKPVLHLFDEPQFNTQDGYIGFMLDFFRKLKNDGKLVFLCLHPNERYHLDILRECCEQFIFVQNGVVTRAPDFAALNRHAAVRTYLGALANASEVSTSPRKV